MTVGESPARVGGVERVTGLQQYVADIHLENVLHVKLVALDVARARIGRVDASAEDQVAVRSQPALDGETNCRPARKIESVEDGSSTKSGVAHELCPTGRLQRG